MTNVLPLFRRAQGKPEPEEIPFLDWDSFLAQFEWTQGEHVALIGPTGSGKTTLALSLLPLRKYVVAVGTKPRDKTLENLQRSRGFTRIKEWESLDPTVHPKRILWPDARRLDAAKDQRDAILRGLIRIYKEGGWCVYIDELWFIIHTLGLEKVIRIYLQQSRALDISLVVATQRPAFVPLEVYDQSTHLFFWRDNDERNLKRISGISWLSANLVRGAVARLAKHEVLYINTRDGLLLRTLAPAPGGR